MKFTLLFVLLMLPFAAQAQAPAASEAPKPEAAKPEAMKADKEEDVQMSEEAIAKAKAEEEAVARKKAADDAAAERQRQREARLALCVIKPVMSDTEIELCKVAYREDR